MRQKIEIFAKIYMYSADAVTFREFDHKIGKGFVPAQVTCLVHKRTKSEGDKARPEPGHGHACLAQWWREGRGREGKGGEGKGREGKRADSGKRPPPPDAETDKLTPSTRCRNGQNDPPPSLHRSKESDPPPSIP